jgi:hypothetical protein
MSTSNIVIGQLYKHDGSGIILKCESASTEDQYIQLVEPACYAERNRFVASWRGDLSVFKAEWSDLEQPELPLQGKPKKISQQLVLNTCLLN